MPFLSFITNLDDEVQIWVSWVVNIWQILVKMRNLVDHKSVFELETENMFHLKIQIKN